jgi:hypothetical protein
MTADLNGEDGSDPPQGQGPTRDNPPLPADLIITEPSPAKPGRHRRVAEIVIAVIAGLLVGSLSPPVNQIIDNIGGYFFGVDQPIELSSICKNMGGIVAPHAETNAAYQWHCAHSSRSISRHQIEQRCTAQWGPDAQLFLRDPNSASGWKCHTPGLLS